jgi:hypothetical protein
MASYIIRTEEDKAKVSKIIRDLRFLKSKKITIETYDLRTVEQNAQQWPYLTAFSEQKLWPVGDEFVQLTPEEWKDLLTASYKEETLRMSPTLSGRRLVMLGLRTSKIDKDDWPDWMAFLKWAAADNGIRVPIAKNQLQHYGNF